MPFFSSCQLLVRNHAAVSSVQHPLLQQHKPSAFLLVLCLQIETTLRTKRNSTWSLGRPHRCLIHVWSIEGYHFYVYMSIYLHITLGFTRRSLHTRQGHCRRHSILHAEQSTHRSAEQSLDL